jgi:hypothetical protein
MTARRAFAGRARGDSEQRGDEVSADQPADDEVEGSQAPPVTGLGWYGVGDRRAAVPGCFDLRDDVLHGGRERGSTATGDEQRISLAAGVDDQHAAGRASPQEGPADVLIGDGGGVERIAVDRVELADELAGDLCRGDERDRHSVGGGGEVLASWAPRSSRLLLLPAGVVVR